MFIGLAALTGLVAEHFGLQNGTLFGGRYMYNEHQFLVWDVPISVIFYWAVFIYTGYCVVTSLFYWLHKEKPCKSEPLLYLPIAILLDGFVVTAVDLFMDPIQVVSGSWIWIDRGSYFGVPVGNFFGWFMVTVVVTGIFRTFEYLLPSKRLHYDRSVFLIPVLGYLVMALSFFVYAVSLKMYSLSIIGCLVMLPIPLVSIGLFRWRYKS